jgi:predicted Zn-dependent protease
VDPRILREQVTLAFIGHEYTAARPLLEDLLKQEPDAAGLNLLLGESWLDSKEPAKAVPFLERAVRADPKLLRARGVLGRAYVEAGQAAPAIPHLEAALPTDEDGSLHFQLARAYRDTGQAEGATRTLQTFQEIRRANEARRQTDKEEFAITPP